MTWSDFSNRYRKIRIDTKKDANLLSTERVSNLLPLFHRMIDFACLTVHSVGACGHIQNLEMYDDDDDDADFNGLKKSDMSRCNPLL